MEIEKLSGRGWLRVLVAILGVAALIFILVSTESDASDERGSSEASAVRLAEIYTKGAFFALIAVGFVLCSYVLTRAGDGDYPGGPPDELSPGKLEEERRTPPEATAEVEGDWEEEVEEESREQTSTPPDKDRRDESPF
jgi:hypothetical protein